MFTAGHVLRKELAATQHALELERQKVIALERALAQSQANVEWLRLLYNQSANDRAAISAMKFGTPLPAPQLEGTLQTPQDVIAAAEQRAAAPAGLQKAVLEEDDLDKALENYTGMAGGFGDVGDAEAERLGITHADDGSVAYK
jgi:hypothetical protein